ncbi:reverse transcriptase domain-containing protein [Tanacetum coccineum]
MPLSYIWKKSLPAFDQNPNELEFAERNISTTPTGIAEDVFVKVGTFFFPADFVVVDYVADPWVPLILGRPFLRTARALIDVHGEQMTLRHDDQSVTFKVGDTKTFSYNIIESVNRVDVIDIACEEYVQEVLEISKRGNPTSTSNLMIDSRSPSFTPFEGSDFLMEEIDEFLELDDSMTTKVLTAIYDSDSEITIYLEEFVKYRSIVTPISSSQFGELMLPEKLLMEGKCQTRSSTSEKELTPKIYEDIKPRSYQNFLDTGLFTLSHDSPGIPIDTTIKRRITINCPYGTFSYRRMPFGLCNAPGTFQRYMVAIFHDMIEKTMDVFMDDNGGVGYDDDGDGEVAVMVVLAAVGQQPKRRGREKAQVGASGVDRVTRKLFEAHRKTPPEKFSGGGDVVAGGGRGGRRWAAENGRGERD